MKKRKPNEKTYYGSKYWGFFWGFLLLTPMASLDYKFIYVIYIIVAIIFIDLTNKSFKEFGSELGWLWGLLVFVPVGFWVVLLFAMNKLKNVERWEEPIIDQDWNYRKKFLQNN